MAFDNLLMFKSSGTLSVSVSSSALKIYGTDVEGMQAKVIIPSSAETTATVLPRYWVSDDDSTYTLLATYEEGAQNISKNTGSAKVLITPIVTNKKYIKEELVVVGTTATSFGAVISGLVEGEAFDWSRAVNFE